MVPNVWQSFKFKTLLAVGVALALIWGAFLLFVRFGGPLEAASATISPPQDGSETTHHGYGLSPRHLRLTASRGHVCISFRLVAESDRGRDDPAVYAVTTCRDNGRWKVESAIRS